MGCGGHICERDRKHYSDVDVYYDDGTSESLCSSHAWEATKSTTKKVVQGVPQHGSDNVNQPVTT
jgi:hypothetical protein